MISPRVRWVPAVLLVAILFAAVSPLPAADRARDRSPGAAFPGGWAEVRSLVSALFGALGKSGNTLDPNGLPAPGSGDAGTAQASDGRSESGSSLDPNGAQ